jgi:hypothetical protein
MPYVPHIRVTMSGTLGSAVDGEAFACGFQIGGEGTDAVVAFPVPQQMEDVSAACQLWFSRATSSIWNTAKLTQVKFAIIGANGLYAGDPYISTFLQVSGASSSNTHPFQVSRVITLDTARNGPTGRGRFYSPAPTGSVESDGSQQAAVALEAAGSAKTLISDVNIALTGAARVVVASSAGYNSSVTSVRVGRVLDTVRSRRTSLREGYTPDQLVVA